MSHPSSPLALAFTPLPTMVLLSLLASPITLLLSSFPLLVLTISLTLSVVVGVGIVAYDGFKGRPECLDTAELISNGDDALETAVEFVYCGESMLEGL